MILPDHLVKAPRPILAIESLVFHGPESYSPSLTVNPAQEAAGPGLMTAAADVPTRVVRRRYQKLSG